jgi:hypothetical protein
MGVNAVGQLSLLKAEFASAKSRWELLLDVIMLGYKDAYNEHKNALKEFEQIRKLHDQQDAAVMMFIYSVVAVGFAGGLVGGLLAPWVRSAGTSVFQTAIRSGVQEIAKSATKEATSGIINRLQNMSKAAPTGNPYEPVTPDKFDVYLEKKKELDECFARFDKMIDDLQQQAAAEDWPIDVGWLLFNGFRASCPILRDKPDPDRLPAPETIQKAAELCMWVQWAEVRDWDWWNKQYRYIDGGLPSQGGFWPNQSAAFDFAAAIRYSLELSPIYTRLNLYGKTPEVQTIVQTVEKTDFAAPRFTPFLDLRKLRKLKVTSMPDLPFGQMKQLDFSVQTNLQLRGKFLDGLSDLRPLQKRAAASP